MAGQARNLPMRAEGESSVIITARACPVSLRPYWRRPLARRCSRWVIDLAPARLVTGRWRDPERTLRRLRDLPGSSPMVPSLHPSACYALAAADHHKDAQVNQFHDHGRVCQHAAMTGRRRQAAGAVAPAGWRPSGWAGCAAAGWALVFVVRGVYRALGGTVGLGTVSPGIQQAAVARDRALLAARDGAILKAVGMSPRQLLAMVMTASAVLGGDGWTGRAAVGRPHLPRADDPARAAGRQPPSAVCVRRPPPDDALPAGRDGPCHRPRRRSFSCPSSRPQPGRRDPAIGGR
jgi:hypothetical protein